MIFISAGHNDPTQLSMPNHPSAWCQFEVIG